MAIFWLSLGSTGRFPGDFWWWSVPNDQRLFDVFLSGQKTFSASQIPFWNRMYQEWLQTSAFHKQDPNPKEVWTSSLGKKYTWSKNKHLQPPFKIFQPTHIPPQKNEKVSDPFRSLVELQPEENGLRLRPRRSVALSAIATPPRTTTQSQRCPRRPAGKQKKRVTKGSGQIITTSADVTLNGGLIRELPPNPLNSGLGIILICPEGCKSSEMWTKNECLNSLAWQLWSL